MVEAEIKRRTPAPAVATAVRLLNALSERSGGASLDELTRSVGQPRSTVHRVLTTLVSEDVVHRSEPRGGYRLGPKLVVWGYAYQRGIDLFEEFQRVAGPIAVKIDETVQLAVLDWPDIVYVATADANRAVRAVTEVGRRGAASATAAGKVLLSAHPHAAERDEYVSLLRDGATTSTTQLRDELSQVRDRGFAEEQQEAGDNVYCVAAPVRAADEGVVIAAMSICVAGVPEPGYRDLVAHCVRNGAEQLSKRLGASTGLQP